MNKKGFSLVEAVLAVFIGGLLIFLVANLPNSFNLISKSKNQSIAREIAIKQVEDLRSITYENLALGEETILDSRLSILPQGSGSLTIEECEVTLCANGEEIKTAKIAITWKENSKPQKVEVTTMIGKGGLSQ